MPTRTAQEQFDRQAVHYNDQWNKWNEGTLAWLVERAAAKREDRVLDVATGTGFTARAFAPLAAEVVGIDVSEGMLAQARKLSADAGLGNIRFQQARAESLPFEDSWFDIVLSRIAPHHFVSVPKFAAESFRVLKPGGRFLVADSTVPDGAPEVRDWQNRVEQLRDPSHKRNYAAEEWRGIVKDAGFEVGEVESLPEKNPISMRTWLEKGGCVGDAAAEVERTFRDAPAEAKRIFNITVQPDGDTQFQWLRIVLSARKPA
jgi:ubiquinone/menaquinone biosynthesis C-methylase UbiE